MRHCSRFSRRPRKRFLFLQYERALGAALHSTPSYEALKTAVPDAFIAVAGCGFAKDIFRNNPFVDKLWITPDPLAKFLPAAGFFLRTVRRERNHFDCVVINAGNRRFKTVAMAILSGIRPRVGFSTRRGLVDEPVEYDDQLSMIENNARALNMRLPSIREPRVFFTQRDADHAIGLLKGEPAGPHPVIAMITQTSGGEPNAWFEARFAELATNLNRTLGATLVFVGTKSERPAIERLRSTATGRTISVAGETTIPQLAALLSRCDLAVGVDTGTFHVARSVRLPGVVLGAAHNRAHVWLPLDDSRYCIVRHDELCCRSLNCPDRACMRAIQVDDAIAAVRTHLDKWPASEAARVERMRDSILPNSAVSIPGSGL